MIITIYKCLHYKYLRDLFTLRSTIYSHRGTDIFSLCKPVSTSYFLYLSFMYFQSMQTLELSTREH